MGKLHKLAEMVLGKVPGALELNNLILCSKYYRGRERKSVLGLIKRVRRETSLMLTNREAYQLCSVVESLSKVAGDIAEVGVYRGGSAKLICELKRDKKLSLFDTFEGLPEKTSCDERYFAPGQFSADMERVRQYLAHDGGVTIYKGLFEETCSAVRDNRFSLAHVDVDIYQSAMACLTFFYPRLVTGGVILSHDYTTSRGVRAAFLEFFNDKPEPFIELSGTQYCIVSKTPETSHATD